MKRQMSRPAKASRHAFGLVALAALLVSGCVSHSTGETEVGVLVCKIGLGCAKKGVQDQLYPPGSTNVFAPFIRDFYTFDTKVQNLEMTATTKGGDRAERDDLQFEDHRQRRHLDGRHRRWTLDPQLIPSDPPERRHLDRTR